MNLSDFDFDLPESFIAQTPLKNREDSKLLLLNRSTQEREHTQVKNIINFLGENDVIVFNKSRVIPARIKGDFGEILLSKPHADHSWECLVYPGKKFKQGKIHILPEGLEAEVKEVYENGIRVIEFHSSNDLWNFHKWLDAHGEIPKPPYVKNILEHADRYQTVFSTQGKSVAAPTAGLHFTEDILNQLRDRRVQIEFVHLDVGLGTFLPVKTENIHEHTMHSEYFELDKETAKRLNNAKKQGKRIIAVGTTSIRVLESCSSINSELQAKKGETDIFIYPGYKFRFVDAVFTNFHTPKSTLLMLVSAFIQNDLGEEESLLKGRDIILQAYEEAKKHEYRFFSFGDAMFIV